MAARGEFDWRQNHFTVSGLHEYRRRQSFIHGEGRTDKFSRPLQRPVGEVNPALGVGYVLASTLHLCAGAY